MPSSRAASASAPGPMKAAASTPPASASSTPAASAAWNHGYMAPTSWPPLGKGHPCPASPPRPPPEDRGCERLRHINGSLLTIEYLWEHDWSKRFRDGKLADGRTLLDASVQQVSAVMAGKEFIYVANLDCQDEVRVDLPGGLQVSSVCHGLNAYDHIDNCVFFSALKFTGDRYKCLE